MDNALRGLVGRRPVQEAGGPETLRGLFRLDATSAGAGRRAEGHPAVRSIDGEVDSSGAWSLRVFLRVPQREDSWQLTPIAKFDVRSGGRPTLDWATLTAAENCRIVDGVVLVDPNVRSATFSGVTATGSHPVDAHMAGVTVDIQKARGTSA
jgi:hypothetical protein